MQTANGSAGSQQQPYLCFPRIAFGCHFNQKTSSKFIKMYELLFPYLWVSLLLIKQHSQKMDASPNKQTN